MSALGNSEDPDERHFIKVYNVCLNNMVSRERKFIEFDFMQWTWAFSSNFGKMPLAKIGKNVRLNIKIGRN